MDSTRELVRKLRMFVDGTDRSVQVAGEIEVMLDDLYQETEPYASLALALASYRPSGGDFLYDADQIAKMMAPVLKRLEDSD